MTIAVTLPPRLVEVRVGPPGGAGKSWKDPLFIEFEVPRTSGRAPSKSKAKLHMLGPDSLQWLDQPGMLLYILAGEGVSQQLFAGDIASNGVKTKKTGPNWVTTIDAADGRRKYRDTIFSKSYPPGITLDVILADLITALGIPLAYKSSLLPPVTFAGGWAFSGRARDALSELLDPIGASWSIQNGSLQILAALEPAPGNAILISPNTGMHGSPERSDKGVVVTTTLTPAMAPGLPFTLQSIFVTGSYKATTVLHKGNSRGLEWKTKITGVPLA